MATKAARTGDAAIITVCTLPMTFSKETKGTYVYVSDDPDAAITTLYIRKTAMERPNASVGPLKQISVTVHGG